jgi:hypothetical protein
LVLWFDAASEIERKFLVPKLPSGLQRSPATRIEQGYIAIVTTAPKSGFGGAMTIRC